MRTTPWPVLAGISLALLAATAASAEGLPSTAAIGNGVLAMGVSSDGGLAQGGLGVKFAATGTDGLPAACACDASLSVGSTMLSESVESFTITPTSATSSVLATDAAGGTRLRMTQDFHPSLVAPNLYEVVVTVENLGTSAVQATYARGVTWLTPTQQYAVPLQTIAPGGSEEFRLYFGAGTSVLDATSGFGAEGASVVAMLPGATTFAFGYAAGETPSGGSAGNGPTGGGGAPSSNAGPVDPGTQPQTGGPSTTASGPTDNGVPPTGSGPTDGDAPTNSAGPVNTGNPAGTSGPSTGSGPASNNAPPPTGDASKDSGAPALNLDPPSLTTDSLLGFQPAATPELDSLTLMASGLGGFGIYALARSRTRSRKRGKRR